MQTRAYSILEIRSVSEDARVIRGIATTPSPDRMGDIVEPMGVSFKNPLALLWQHNHDEPVGTVKFDRPTKDGIGFEAKIATTDAPGTLKDRLDEAWQSVKMGLVRAVSIGFRALEYSRLEEGGLRFIKTEVLELSLVTIPANAEATITQIKSIDKLCLAASGRKDMARRGRPGTPGARDLSHKDSQMKTIAEQIAELETRRVQLGDEMKAFGDVAELDTEQAAEYDLVAKEFEDTEAPYRRLLQMQKAMGTATPVRGESRQRAADSRIVVPAKAKVELEKGIRFARYALAVMAGKGSISDTLAYAKRWDAQTPEVSAFIKASAGTSVEASPGWGSELVYQDNLASEFIELLRPATVIGRIAGFRMVPFNVRVASQTNGASVNWVGEAASKPVGDEEFGEVTLGYNKIAGIVAFSEELLRLSTPNVETLVRNDLVAGISKFMDEQFLLSTVTATSTRPAAVTNGVTGAAATGLDADALYYDLNIALAAYDAANSSLDTLVIVMTPALARGISTLRNALGQMEFTGMTPKGGTLLGFPVLVSNSCPSGNIILINASDILMADDGTVRLDSSNQATLDMAGGDTPDVNLWQKNLIAIRAERWITWKKARSTAVNRITSAAYGPQSDSSPA